MRINTRGDRRYRQSEIDRFLAQAKVVAHPVAKVKGRKPSAHPATGSDRSSLATAVIDEIARVSAEARDVEQLVADVASTLCRL